MGYGILGASTPVEERGRIVTVRPRQILVVCYGNICRSPLAEALLRRVLQERGLDGRFEVASAGVGAVDGQPAAPLTQVVAASAGLDLGAHQARRLTPAMAHAADVLIAMDEVVEDLILRIAGDIPVEAWHVDDPYGGPEDGYRAAFTTIDRLVQGLADRLDGTVTAAPPPNG